MADAVTVKNTSYKKGHIVVIGVESDDVLVIGQVLKVVVRDEQVLFLVSNYEAARTRFRFFEVNRMDKISLVPHSSLADYKPLVAIGNEVSFKFVLHHHIPVKSFS